MKILVTCPPMIGIKHLLVDEFARIGLEPHYASVVQTLDESELLELVPQFDGWIIGDDPATYRVFEAGKAGRLKAAVKWGVGVDNVDFDACKDLGIPVSNTPGMFGDEVADIAIGYLVGLARQTYFIDREVRKGGWPKPRGRSLRGKTVGLVGCGDIGLQTLKRLSVMGCDVVVFDPFVDGEAIARDFGARVAEWPETVAELDYVVLTCALTPATRLLLGADFFLSCKPGVGIVNVSRGGLIDQEKLITALASGQISSAALEVFEEEPVTDDRLLGMENCIFGSHNASNTEEAVFRTSKIALNDIARALSRE